MLVPTVVRAARKAPSFSPGEMRAKYSADNTGGHVRQRASRQGGLPPLLTARIGRARRARAGHYAGATGPNVATPSQPRTAPQRLHR